MKKVILGSAVAVLFATGASKPPYKLHVPSDPNATYTILDIGSKGNLYTIITKREGKSGTTYSQRAYDCHAGKVMYLGSGETLEEMHSSKPDDHLSPIVDGSIADYVGKEACS
ncbi:hypothetical protein [Mixta gaviniae]|uniref:Uncharacterized protein n=1 Tax=Mixta gaviniae TaxID=665914 RepID=A0A2L0II99_9GAMM|nr:hypothetical protein [Mixta gaviniae]AUX94229.1 hypothetical protein C2E15_14860 [Mixta gaviniae]